MVGIIRVQNRNLCWWKYIFIIQGFDFGEEDGGEVDDDPDVKDDAINETNMQVRYFM